MLFGDEVLTDMEWVSSGPSLDWLPLRTPSICSFVTSIGWETCLCGLVRLSGPLIPAYEKFQKSSKAFHIPFSFNLLFTHMLTIIAAGPTLWSKESKSGFFLYFIVSFLFRLDAFLQVITNKGGNCYLRENWGVEKVNFFLKMHHIPNIDDSESIFKCENLNFVNVNRSVLPL